MRTRMTISARGSRLGLAVAAAAVALGPVAPALAMTPSEPSAPAPRPYARELSPHRFGTVAYSQWYAREYMRARYGWGSDELACLKPMWMKESEWHVDSDDSDGGYTWGIPQARPGTKMASAGADWRTNPETQIRWGLRYIKSTYGTPCAAWDFWQGHGWY